MTPTRPYILRAIYEWLLDNNQTPYILVRINAHTQVPDGYANDGNIVLSISPTATQGLIIDNDAIHFSARFGGISHDIYLPISTVMSIFSKEERSYAWHFSPDEYPDDNLNDGDDFELI